MWTYNQNPYELYHHGILGMKWGVRRYTNADGSLNAAGKERYYTNGKLNKKGVRAKRRSANIASNDTSMRVTRFALGAARTSNFLNPGKSYLKNYIHRKGNYSLAQMKMRGEPIEARQREAAKYVAAYGAVQLLQYGPTIKEAANETYGRIRYKHDKDYKKRTDTLKKMPVYARDLNKKR